MRLTVSKLGRIDHAEIELAPLTVFVGPNNTNKTWTAYALYALLKRENALADDETMAAIERAIAPLNDAIYLGGESTVKVRLDRARLLRELDGASVRLTIPGSWLFHVIGADVSESTVALEVDPLAGDVDWNAAVEHEVSNGGQDRTTTILHSNGDTAGGRHVISTEEVTTEKLHAEVRSSALELLLDAGRNVYAFPASRAAITALLPNLADDASAMNGLTTVARDFVSWLTRVRRLHGKRVRPQPFAYAKQLEELLDGNVVIGSDEQRRALDFETSTGARVPIRATASMVQSLAALALRLHDGISAGDTLIIDEPEMNAHPEAQLAIAELLAILVTRGVRIVLTTHSPYLVDHFGLLVEASKLAGEERAHIVSKLALKTDAALLRPDQLGVWHFGTDGKVTEVFDRKEAVIDTATFADVGIEQANLFGEILSAERRLGH